jgi:hypothetical protein
MPARAGSWGSNLSRLGRCVLRAAQLQLLRRPNGSPNGCRVAAADDYARLQPNVTHCRYDRVVALLELHAVTVTTVGQHDHAIITSCSVFADTLSS